MLKSEAPMSFANGLSLELWAQIFSLQMSDVPQETAMRFLSPRRIFSQQLSQQASFYRLRLVSKRFNEVFLQYPDLCRGLVFRQQQADTLSPSLVAWLKPYHTSVQALAAYCGNSELILLLEILSSGKNQLQSVHLQNHLCVFLPFAAFDHLTVLEVVQPGYGFASPLDLSTLQLSKSLRTLVMQDGIFKTKSLPPNLTYLFLARSRCTSYEGCSCVTSLTQLNLVDSSIYGLHSKGLLACHALERLTCQESCITAADMQLSFNQDSLRIPLGLSALTSLRYLDATIASTSTVILCAFCQLKSLQDLTVRVCGASVCANSSLSQLSMLTSLRLLAQSANHTAGVRVFTEWPGMQALQVLDITCDYFSFGCDILGLVKLESLRKVNIMSGRPYDHKSFAFFAALVHGIAKHPCAQLRLNDVPVAQVLAEGLQYCIGGIDAVA
ncbi:TPA: hypothetical protein ACH3X2_007262 [Trebouxia sp. C0005]